MQHPLRFRFTRTLLVFVGAIAALATLVRAQTAPDGVLGQRYVSTNLDLVDFDRLTDYGSSAGVGVNLPVLANVDLGFDFAYGWLNTSGQSLREKSVGTVAVWHASSGLIRPFVAGGVGYDWTREYFNWSRQSDTSGFWNLSAGFELPVHGLTVSPSIGYTDWFRDRWVGATRYAVEVNRWITPSLGGYAAVAYNDYSHQNGYSWMYRVGLRVKF